MLNKSNTITKFKIFQSQVECKFATKIHSFRTDCGSKFLSGVFDTLFKAVGIQQDLIATYILHQNNIKERKNCTLLKKAKPSSSTHALHDSRGLKLSKLPITLPIVTLCKPIPASHPFNVSMATYLPPSLYFRMPRLCPHP